MVRQKCHFLFVHQQHLNLNVYIIISVLAGGILIRNDEIISCELLTAFYSQGFLASTGSPGSHSVCNICEFYPLLKRKILCLVK